MFPCPAQHLCVICIKMSTDNHWVLSSFHCFLCNLCKYIPKWQTDLYTWNPARRLIITRRKTDRNWNLYPKAPNTPKRWPGVDSKTGSQMFTSAITYVLDANLLSNYIANYERPMKYKQLMWEQDENLVLTYRGSWVQGLSTAKGNWISKLWFKPGPYQEWPISRMLQCHLSFWWAFSYQISKTHRLSTLFFLPKYFLGQSEWEILLGCLQPGLWSHATE